MGFWVLGWIWGWILGWIFKIPEIWSVDLGRWILGGFWILGSVDFGWIFLARKSETPPDGGFSNFQKSKNPPRRWIFFSNQNFELCSKSLRNENPTPKNPKIHRKKIRQKIRPQNPPQNPPQENLTKNPTKDLNPPQENPTNKSDKSDGNSDASTGALGHAPATHVKKNKIRIWIRKINPPLVSAAAADTTRAQRRSQLQKK